MNLAIQSNAFPNKNKMVVHCEYQKTDIRSIKFTILYITYNEMPVII